jgi:hypothetical protein
MKINGIERVETPMSYIGYYDIPNYIDCTDEKKRHE